jgi:AAA domain
VAVDKIATRLPVLQAAHLEQRAEQAHWLIEGLWARSAIGLIGGSPKCCKTWFGLDMAVSVASGTDALGHFPTKERDAALVYLAEDALPQVRGRIDAICRHRGCDIEDLDLHVITAPSLRLDQSVDQERLAAAVEALQPRLVLLDPLVRLHRLDENSASEISGLLGYFRDLQRRFDTAIVIVHHASKKQRAQPGQALRGSSDLHAIGDCNAYLARKGKRIQLTIEHRAARSPDPMMLELLSDDLSGATSLAVCGTDVPTDDAEKLTLEDRVVEILTRENAPLSRNALRARARANNQRLGEVLTTLDDLGRITRSGRGWAMT